MPTYRFEFIHGADLTVDTEAESKAQAVTKMRALAEVWDIEDNPTMIDVRDDTTYARVWLNVTIDQIGEDNIVDEWET